MKRHSVWVLLLLASCIRAPNATPAQRWAIGLGQSLDIAYGVRADLLESTTVWLRASCQAALQMRDEDDSDAKEQAFETCSRARSLAQDIQGDLDTATEYLRQGEAYFNGLARLGMSEGDRRAAELNQLASLAVADATAILIRILTRKPDDFAVPQSVENSVNILRGVQ